MDPWELTSQMLHGLPNENRRQHIVVTVEDEEGEEYELSISPTGHPGLLSMDGNFDPISSTVNLDHDEMSMTMTVDEIMQLLYKYNITEVARLEGNGHPNRFRRATGNLLGVENQTRKRMQRSAPKLPKYNNLPTGQGIVTKDTNWGFGGGMEWDDLPVYLDGNVNQRNMHVRHVIPYAIIEGEVKRGRQQNPFNRSRFEIEHVRRVTRNGRNNRRQ